MEKYGFFDPLTNVAGCHFVKINHKEIAAPKTSNWSKTGHKLIAAEDANLSANIR